MAGSMARRRDHSEGAAGERLDHQEEQRLQRGAPETQVIQTHQYFNNQKKKKNRARFGWLLKHSFAVFACYKFYKPPSLLRKHLQQSHNRTKTRGDLMQANINRDYQPCKG